ncbi:MAG: hypothetical protein AB8B97_22970 [Granulosicoccus sp.]
MLVTCATYNYLDMLTLLLASHNASNPQVPLHVHAIDWPEVALDSIRSLYPNAVFHAHQKTREDGPTERRGPVPRTANILKLKVDMLYKAYQESHKPVIWVDADTLLLASIQPMLERVEHEGDFGVTYRSKKRDHAKFAVAVLCFTRSEASASLLESYAQGVKDSQGMVKRKDKEGVAWFHDQLGLWQAYRAQSRNMLGFPRRNRPRLVALDDNEHSIDGNTQAIFVSRRDKLFDIEHMRAELKKRGIGVPGVTPQILE